jgi:hypothetical protein
MRCQWDFTAIGQAENPSVIMKFALLLTADLNQKGSQKKTPQK